MLNYYVGSTVMCCCSNPCIAVECNCLALRSAYPDGGAASDAAATFPSSSPVLVAKACRLICKGHGRISRDGGSNVEDVRSSAIPVFPYMSDAEMLLMGHYLPKSKLLR